MLDVQYRSHPAISDFPRHYFYDGKLLDGDNTQGGGYAQPWHKVKAARPLERLLLTAHSYGSLARLSIKALSNGCL
jgi:hypothetical protein